VKRFSHFWVSCAEAAEAYFTSAVRIAFGFGATYYSLSSVLGKSFRCQAS
jgi:hypothetical protein